MAGLIIFYLILFPFGKLTSVLPDLLVIIICLWGAKKYKLKINNFLFVGLFSLLFSLTLFKLPEILIGVLYFLRFASYLLFSGVIYQKFGKNKTKIDFIFNSLIIIGISIAIFGWIQYFIFPDLRALKDLGWDDHYFRLVSTFLDPAFTGILLVLAEILVVIKTIEKKTRLNFILNIFLIITIAFTYSRGSFLSLLFAFAYLFWKFKSKLIPFLLVLFVVSVFVLPKQSGGEGVNLTRTHSITDRFENYKESLILIQKSPIFGIGFDNVCVAKEKFLRDKDITSHACSGLDNSLLFILATTGIVGLMIFTQSILRIVNKTTQDIYGVALIASFVAVFVHGMFTNTFFYNFILGYLAILIGITRLKD